MRRLWNSAPLGLIVLLISATAIHATSLVRQDLGEQIDLAELIFEGSVVNIETALTKKTGYPFTLVTFQVERTFKGELPANGELTLRFTGGETDEIFAYTPSVPRFEVGGRHVLFVAGNTKALCPLVGWSQGKLDFRQHPETGAPILTDHSGWPVTGIENDQWVLAEQAINADGFWKEPRVGIVLLEQDGVEITGLPERNAVRALDLPTADAVLSGLQSKVVDQQGRSTYRQPVPVVSATALDEPFSGLPGKGGER
ncbi:MAG: hypothetical protein AAF481_08800 [Acidobacteriota bacterium]